MVSFSCEVCNDVVKKPKLDAHRGQCRGAYFTCIDCNTTFAGGDHRAHTSCISEAQKYQGALYKPDKGKGKGKGGKKGGEAARVEAVVVVVETGREEKAAETAAAVGGAAAAEEAPKKEKKSKRSGGEKKDEEPAPTAEPEPEPEAKEEKKPKKDKKDKKGKKGKAEEPAAATATPEEPAPAADEPEATPEEPAPAAEAAAAEEPKLTRSEKKQLKHKRKLEAEAGKEEGEGAPKSKRAKEEVAKEVAERRVLGQAFIDLVQPGTYPLQVRKAVEQLEKTHGAEVVQRDLWKALCVKKEKDGRVSLRLI